MGMLSAVINWVKKTTNALGRSFLEEAQAESPDAICEILEAPKVIMRSDTPGAVECLLYHIRKTGLNGEVSESFRAVRPYRFTRLPNVVLNQNSFLEDTDDVIVGLYKPDQKGKSRAVTFFHFSANILQPAGPKKRNIGIMQGWGFIAYGPTEEAARAELERVATFGINKIFGKWTSMGVRPIDADEAEGILGILEDPQSMTLYGVGNPERRMSPGQSGKSDFIGGETNADVRLQNEEWQKGMHGAGKEYFELVICAPLNRDYLETEALKIGHEVTSRERNVMQTEGVSVGAALPLSQSFGAAQGSSLGTSEGLAQSENLGINNTEGVAQATGLALSETETDTLGLSHARSSTETLSESDTHTDSTGTNYGYSQGSSTGEATGQNTGTNVGTTQGTNQGTSTSQGTGTSANTSTTDTTGNARTHGTTDTVGQTITDTTSWSHTTGTSTGNNWGVNAQTQGSTNTEEGSQHSDDKLTGMSGSRNVNDQLDLGTSGRKSTWGKSNEETLPGSYNRDRASGTDTRAALETRTSLEASAAPKVMGFGGGLTASVSGGGHAAMTSSDQRVDSQGEVFKTGARTENVLGNMHESRSGSTGYSDGQQSQTSDSVFNNSVTRKAENMLMGKVGGAVDKISNAALGFIPGGSMIKGLLGEGGVGSALMGGVNSLTGGLGLGGSFGGSSSQSESYTTGGSHSIAHSTSHAVSESTTDSTSQARSTGTGTSTSQGTGTSQGSSAAQTAGSSQGISTSQNVGQNTGTNFGSSSGSSDAHSTGRSTATGTSDSTSLSQSKGSGTTASASETVSSATGVSAGRGATGSAGTSAGLSSQLSGSIGLSVVPTMSLNRSTSYTDWNRMLVFNRFKVMFQRFNDMSQKGGFWVQIALVVRDEESADLAQGLMKSSFHGENVDSPFEMQTFGKPQYHESFRNHVRAFALNFEKSPDPMPGKDYGFLQTYSAPEAACLFHPSRVAIGGQVFAEDYPNLDILPELDVASPIAIGYQIDTSTQRPTKLRYTWDISTLRHRIYAGQSRVGKTVGYLNDVLAMYGPGREGAIKEGLNPKWGILDIDPTDDHKDVLPFLDPTTYRYYNMTGMGQFAFYFNPLRLPEKVTPDSHIANIVKGISRVYGFGVIGMSILQAAMSKLYETAGVMDAWKKAFEDKEGWEKPAELSKTVTMEALYKEIFRYRVSVTSDKDVKGTALEDMKRKMKSDGPALTSGFEVTQTIDSILKRLEGWTKTESVLYALACDPATEANRISWETITSEALGKYTLIGTSFQSGNDQRCFVEMLVSGIVQKALDTKCFVLPDGQPAMRLVLEEFHRLAEVNQETAGGGDTLNEQNIYEILAHESGKAGLYMSIICQDVAALPSALTGTMQEMMFFRTIEPQSAELTVQLLGLDPRVDHRVVARYLKSMPVGEAIVRSSQVKATGRDSATSMAPVLVRVHFKNMPKITHAELEQMSTGARAAAF